MRFFAHSYTPIVSLWDSEWPCAGNGGGCFALLGFETCVSCSKGRKASRKGVCAPPTPSGNSRAGVGAWCLTEHIGDLGRCPFDAPPSALLLK